MSAQRIRRTRFGKILAMGTVKTSISWLLELVPSDLTMCSGIDVYAPGVDIPDNPPDTFPPSVKQDGTSLCMDRIS